MKYVECPDVYNGPGKRLFLAGGISGCQDWQKDMVNSLKDENLVLINPRRKNFNTNNPEMEKEQIRWEFEELKKTDIASFWFPPQTLCPITLYELGKISMTDKPLFVGVDPGYARKNDIYIQTSLLRPDVKIVDSIDKLVNQIKALEVERGSLLR